ncbi:GntR family transcriptional regulator [Larsenimonas rhizosphaerae]|uniref:GntR family transcriptional regulator n=1 Tax=Larsenimonas rhizosphaerae TaxID=2944682 RepID=A0AA41ZID8_9GAMM|nr:GntR family transcriptional regulator [Larsenimonas rhizosphaerae]MCM2131935.1 GntR family transcriptional regulator [Larsenimonas rhizosphaerae]MCX2524759.1 GntR family transcriptional regulator [Larsenimonas rhizosphaerae]
MSDNSSVVARLRKLISEGHYPPDERIAELQVAEELGVSRTPVRLAFRTLEQEGLLVRVKSRGFKVRHFTEQDIVCAIEVRSVLEGLAARRLAEQGISPQVLTALEQCLDDGQAVLANGHLNHDDVATWARVNSRFHGLIVRATQSDVIADALARNNHLPFASSDSLLVDSDHLEREYQKLVVAQQHHVLIVQALRGGEGSRAEMLMREHAYINIRYGRLFGLAYPLADVSR